jgi:plasmid maintenance system antidote protein VapI
MTGETPLLDRWHEEYESDPEYVAEGLALEITEEACRIMLEKGISRARLAELMGVSRAYVTRTLNAPPNLTLKSIAQLALALGVGPLDLIAPAGRDRCRADSRSIP